MDEEIYVILTRKEMMSENDDVSGWTLLNTSSSEVAGASQFVTLSLSVSHAHV